MVPGAERKLREQRGFSSEYLVRTHQKSPGPVANSARKGTFMMGSQDVFYHKSFFTQSITKFFQ